MSVVKKESLCVSMEQCLHNMEREYHIILLFIRGKKFCVFADYLANAKLFRQIFAITCFRSLGELITANVFQQMKLKTWNSETFSPRIKSNIRYDLVGESKETGECVVLMYVLIF